MRFLLIRLLVIENFCSLLQRERKKWLLFFLHHSIQIILMNEKFINMNDRHLTSVSMSALNYKPTDRILTLAKPKIRKETTIRDGKIEENDLS